MRRIEREAIAIEADRIVQLLDPVEHVLYVGLEPVPALSDSTENGRLIVELADETPDRRVEAFLEFAELEFDFSRTEQQPTEHLWSIVLRIAARTVVHPLVEKTEIKRRD